MLDYITISHIVFFFLFFFCMRGESIRFLFVDPQFLDWSQTLPDLVDLIQCGLLSFDHASQGNEDQLDPIATTTKPAWITSL